MNLFMSYNLSGHFGFLKEKHGGFKIQKEDQKRVPSKKLSENKLLQNNIIMLHSSSICYGLDLMAIINFRKKIMFCSWETLVLLTGH